MKFEWVPELFRDVSRLVKQMRPPFNALNFESTQLREFSKKIHPENVVEGMRIAITESRASQSLCKPHVDENNDPNVPAVIVLSKVVMLNEKTYRIAIILYSRKAIGEFYSRKQIFVPCIEHMLHIYHCAPDYRKNVHCFLKRFRETSLQTTVHQRFGHNIFESECNYDPALYHSSIMHFTTMATFHHDLNFLEMISVLRAFAACPQAPVYYCLAMLIVCQTKSLSETVRGCEIGRFVLRIMVQL